MPDSQIRCSDCGELFLFSEQEQAFFAEKGLNTPPKRCKPCRQARKTASPGGGGAGADRGDRGGFGGAARGQRPSGGFGDRSRGGPPARGAPQRGGGEGGWRPRDAGPGAGPQATHAASSNPRPVDSAGRGGGWKTPHAPHAPQPGARARDARERTFAGPAPTPQPHRSPPPREEESAKPAARERAAKPKYDITCAECGAPSQVPFKPLEGRQVYCQPCYRLRKIASPETAPARDLDARDIDAADTGIVE